MDVAIFGDISRSMRKQHRKQMISFIEGLLDKTLVSADGNHVALGTFGDSADVAIMFNEEVFQDTSNLKEAAKAMFMVRPKLVGTRTDLALDLASKEVFTAAGGDRPEAKNILLVVTDGKPYIRKKDKKPFIPFETSTKALEVIKRRIYTGKNTPFIEFSSMIWPFHSNKKIIVSYLHIL